MKYFYSSYIDDEHWLIKESVFERSLQNIREAQFALGNGYLGTRGALEEIPYDAMPGTYLAGVYDRMGSQVAELVNLPNPFNFRFIVGGQKLGVVASDVLEHKRILNTKKALLVRHTLYRDHRRRHYDYQSLRFVSMHNKNIGVMQIIITPLDGDCILDINTGIDTSVSNVGTLAEGRKRHFRVKELGQYRNAGYLVVDTLEKKHTIVFWSGFWYSLDRKKIYASDNIFRLKIKRKQRAIFTKVFFIKDFPYSRDASVYKRKSFNKFYGAFHTDFSQLLREHIRAWERLWRKADVVVEGTANLQQNLRFNIYHLLICAPQDKGVSSVGARTLSGEGYRGHVFWDADIFILPFYLFNFPQFAKNMLLYRYRRLPQAKLLAEKEGFRGVKFPWESADSGGEETPTWSRDFDGTIIRIHTHQMEHHIVADVCYAFYNYFNATHDQEFMKKYGYEVIFETARFWASRVQYNSRKKVYEIKNVIGPDEFHIDVDNNAYTNMMAKWNLLFAYKIYYDLKRNRSGILRSLKKKINLRDEEPRLWRKIFPRMKININKDKIFEQFDGYFKLKYIPLTSTDENGIPLIPPKLRAKDLKKTQIVKQADVLMFLYLLKDFFSSKTVEANYRFYVARTVHKSSLSAPMHSIIASWCGDLNRAYNFFNVALRADISNLYGNTPEGIHAASLGGTWQAVVFGFAGIGIKENTLFIEPRLPHSWHKLKFSLWWRQDLVKLELTNHSITLKIVSKKRKTKLGIFGKIVTVTTNRTHIFEKETRLLQGGYY